jgi:DNA-directed RNA polymerase specialized sigma24 family protein
MSTHVLIQDPNSLSSRFSNEDRLGYDRESEDINNLIERNLAPDDEEDISIDGQPLDFDSISRYLERIPSREADLICLYHKDKMKQEQIAKLFGITQAAVSYRLHRGIRRIQFLRTIPELERDQFELELGPKFCEQDREILWRMHETTCQSEIAKQMNLTQGRVRHRFFRALQKIKDLIADEAREKQVHIQMLRKQGRSADEILIAEKALDDAINNSKYGKYWTVYFAISDRHFNILHEVSLPQFRDRGDAQILTISG